MSKYIIATAEQVAQALGPSYKRVSGWWRGPGGCHQSSGSSTSLAFRDPQRKGSSLAVKCWANCDRDDVLNWIEDTTGLTVRWQPEEDEADTVEAPDPTPPRSRQPDGSTIDIPSDPEHPSRRWLKRFNVWLPSPAILPSGVRWLDEQLSSRAGSLIGGAAPPEAWIKAWPDMPTPTGVQKVRVGYEGEPVEDSGGLNKRSQGNLSNACLMLGDPRPKHSCGIVVVEGLKDGLAVASRRPETVLVLFGTAGWRSEAIAEYAMSFSRIVMAYDRDVPGRDAARKLWSNMELRSAMNGERLLMYKLEMPDGLDPADVAGRQPVLTSGTDVEREMAYELHQRGLPVWEACRQAWTSLRDLPLGKDALV